VKETFDGADMIVDHFAPGFKKGLPAMHPGSGTQIHVFTVEGLIDRQKTAEIQKTIFSYSHRTTGSV
jgi:hypothetical protein